jgi:hypothetical protein
MEVDVEKRFISLRTDIIYTAFPFKIWYHCYTNVFGFF